MKMSEIRMKFSMTPQTLVRKMSAQVKTHHSSTHQATKLLKLYPYRMGVIQELKLSNCPKRVKFW